jgi:hypothetical protein
MICKSCSSCLKNILLIPSHNSVSSVSSVVPILEKICVNQRKSVSKIFGCRQRPRYAFRDFRGSSAVLNILSIPFILSKTIRVNNVIPTGVEGSVIRGSLLFFNLCHLCHLRTYFFVNFACIRGSFFATENTEKKEGFKSTDSTDFTDY